MAGARVDGAGELRADGLDRPLRAARETHGCRRHRQRTGRRRARVRVRERRTTSAASTPKYKKLICVPSIFTRSDEKPPRSMPRLASDMFFEKIPDASTVRMHSPALMPIQWASEWCGCASTKLSGASRASHHPRTLGDRRSSASDSMSSLRGAVCEFVCQFSTTPTSPPTRAENGVTSRAGARPLTGCAGRQSDYPSEAVREHGAITQGWRWWVRWRERAP